MLQNGLCTLVSKSHTSRWQSQGKIVACKWTYNGDRTWTRRKRGWDGLCPLNAGRKGAEPPPPPPKKNDIKMKYTIIRHTNLVMFIILIFLSLKMQEIAFQSFSTPPRVFSGHWRSENYFNYPCPLPPTPPPLLYMLDRKLMVQALPGSAGLKTIVKVSESVSIGED